VLSSLRDRARRFGVHARARIGRGESIQGFYAQHLRFGELAFDVGANKGDHTRYMLKLGARVVAIEPQPDLAGFLRREFPSVTVVEAGLSDAPGEGRLMTASGHDNVATLNPDWPDAMKATVTDAEVVYDGQETIRLTTLDELIAEHGRPALVKIDTEGLDDKVVAGLSRPVDQFLFEVVAAAPDVAARVCERLDELATYEYRVMTWHLSWQFGPPVTPEAILADPPFLGNVHARRVG
jgi:FkbM family methyltransferase